MNMDIHNTTALKGIFKVNKKSLEYAPVVVAHISICWRLMQLYLYALCPQHDNEISLECRHLAFNLDLDALMYQF